jgi:hypothetical protein
MGKSPERIAASTGGDSENNDLGSCEAHDVSRCPQENFGVPESEMGKVEGRAEEGGVEPRRPPAGDPSCGLVARLHFLR